MKSPNTSCQGYAFVSPSFIPVSAPVIDIDVTMV